MNNWDKDEFGARLKRLREQRGSSMMAFGTAIGTSASRIKDWEKGKNAPSAAWIALIAERFNVSTDELILGDTNIAKTFKNSSSSNSEVLFDKLRESILEGNEQVEQTTEIDKLYALLDAKQKERYRSGKGRKQAERELLTIVTQLPKKEVLELLELAKYKKRKL